MPRAKPAPVVRGSQVDVSWSDVAGLDEAKAELEEVVEFLREPQALRAPRRAGSARDPAARAARHGQDAPRQGRRERLGRELLLAERLLVRRALRRARRREDPEAVRGGAQARARDRLHRRARRRRHGAQRRRLPSRARPDAEPAPRRARRLQRARRGGRHGRVEPPPGSRRRPAPTRAASTARCSSPRRTSPDARRSSSVHTRGKPLAPDVDLGAIARQTAGLTGADLANLCNEAAILAGRSEARSSIQPVGLRQRDGADRRRAAAASRRLRQGEAHPRLPRGRSRGHVPPRRRALPGAEGDDRLARPGARLHVQHARRRTATCTRARSSST